MNEKKRKDKGTENQGSPAWMTTYSDLMTLLLVFFVMLVTFSSIELSKFRKAMGSLKGALGVLKAEKMMIKIGEVPPPRTSTEETMYLKKSTIDLKRYIALEGLKEVVQLEESSRGLTITISNPVLFDLGKANLKPEVRPLLDKIGEMIKRSRVAVRVEGHTDNLPIRTSQFPSNWELSTTRAVNVLKYFIENCGVEPARLSAVGYGEYHPRVPNDTEAHRAQNRRVTIRIERSQPRPLLPEE
ncbi:MAG: flagellar motor protein MotB [Candidatus Latescibacterota bacterium]|nr:MAG: flagellar motor protein MotB [Candidatus Latescibacterota bacterium]RKY69859.1 MAG: flagellar motor protein MotB [Candidatus Latescibacterota bacterium]